MGDFFTLNKRQYPIPTEFDLGELCDMEQHFGVVFDEDAKPSVRQTAATLWIAVRRVEPHVRPEQIRALPMHELERITAEIADDEAGDGDPLASSDSRSDSTGASSDATSDTTRSRPRTGSRG